MRSILPSLGLGIAVFLPTSEARQSDPRVNLGYATYDGTSLENGVNQFLGMRFAAAPLGENRFRRPRDPVNESGIIPAKEHGAICHGVQGLPLPTASVSTSEDCLFVDVYAPATPSGACPAHEQSKGLPVLVWFQGGAFVQLFNPNYNGSGIVEASGHKSEGNLNIGLHDQRFALQWVQKHIGAFGGDPDKVTLFGTSVGAGSILLQNIAYGGNPPKEDKTKWNAGIAPAAYMPSVYQVSDLEFEYESILASTKCTDLKCLRSLSSDAIQAANIGKPFPGQSQVALFPYAPVIDNHLFTDHPQTMLQAGNFSRERPLIIGSSHSEGTVFVPQANTKAEIDGFLRQHFPAITAVDLGQAHSLYSDVPANISGVTAPVSPLYFRAAQMYGDVAFTCPTLQFALKLSEADIDIYYLRNNIIDPVEWAAGYLVPHTWEVQAVWGPEYSVNFVALPGANSYNTGGMNRGSVSEVQHIWTEFAAASGNFGGEGLPTSTGIWDRFSLSNRRLRLQTNGTMMESISQKEFDRCAFWAGISSRTLI